LFPSSRVPLTLAVTPFVNAETAAAVVRVNVDAGDFARTDGAPVPLDVAIVAVDRTGKPVASATNCWALMPKATASPIMPLAASAVSTE